ncbi:MAG TPA: TRAP transporter substrate-binding protein DctP [Dehalococcoidales bacterium]|nr:TRAP transporter substrate-binding protein DctP [Dehalococcoidales bacterium]
MTWTLAASRGSAFNVWWSQPYPRFQELLEQATGGRLKIETKVDLFPFGEQLVNVIQGQADMGFTRIPFISGSFPLWDFGSFPFAFAGHYEYEKALNDPRMREILEITHKEAGVKYLFDGPGGACDVIFSNKPLPTVESLKDLKVRVTGLLPTYTLELLGAKPLTMAILELTESLQRGTVDALHTGRIYGLGAGITDVTKYVNFWPIQPIYGGTVYVNLKSWEALPSDLQDIIMKESREMNRANMYAAESVDQFLEAALRATGIELIKPGKAELDKAKKLIYPAVFDKWLEVAGPYGPEVVDIVKKYASALKGM